MRLNLGLTESEEMLKKAALDFMRRDATKETIQALLDTDTGYTAELWRKAAGLGWLGIIIPEEYGGTENPLTSAGALFEALGTGPLPGPYFSSGILSSLIVIESGSEEQKKRLLPAMTEGEQIVTLALTEPEYSWEPGAIKTTASKQGDNFTLSGVKLFVSDAQAATHLIVAARTGQGTGADGISLFLVDKKAKGVSVRRVPGFLAGLTFEVKLDSVPVAASDQLGAADKGWPALQQAIAKAIPVLCAYKVGGCQALLELTLEYSRTRVQFGQAIGRFQRVQDLILEIVNRLDAARWTTYEALWKLDTQKPATESMHLAKAVSSEAYWEACTLAHQVFSGISYSMEHPVSFHTRASRFLYNFLGEPAYHRQQIAKLITA